MSRYIWIGITIGVFFAGIGIGYLVYTNTYNPVTMMQNQQFMQKMIARSSISSTNDEQYSAESTNDESMDGNHDAESTIHARNA
ncbi:MAG: hypothetical protein HZA82_06740 [Thaumarchaeota archaeon]|nr:hypothetical protein [Nitrososphaerota archaeon]